MKKNLKKLFFIIIWLLLSIIIFGGLIFLQMFNTTIKDVVGTLVWVVIYNIIPIIILIIPFLLFKKKIQLKNTILFSITIMILYLILTKSMSLFIYNYIEDFTTAKWMKYRYERKIMIDDLNKKYILTGKSINEIKDILGEPDILLDTEFEYIISRGWIDPEMMVLKFNDDIVVDVYTYTEFKPNK